MKMMLKLASQSIWYRRGAAFITIAAIAVSVFTLLSIEHLRGAAKQSFNSTVSGVDLIVGPRSSDLNLLLTTVFRIGQPTQGMSWQSYQTLAQHNDVAWSIPLSLGDSHRGFRVVGTNGQYFTHFRYGQSQPLLFAKGDAFSERYHVVLGANVAKQLNYRIGQPLVIAHGLGHTSFHQHDAFPFTVSGILQPTNTPADNALYVSLQGLEAIHQPHTGHSATHSKQITPESISAVMLGLSSKLATFRVQREINQISTEPLSAILPGVTLTQLWQLSGNIENTLALMAHLMLLAALLGLAAILLATLRERRYEVAMLRTLGASSFTIFCLIEMESLFITLLGIFLGTMFFGVAVAWASSTIALDYGIDISIAHASMNNGLVLLYVLLGAFTVGSLPAFIGSRGSLNQ